LASLQEQLELLSTKLIQKLPEEFTQGARKEVERLIQEKTATGLQSGTTAPDFTLPDVTGKQVALSDLLQNGPVVLSFYRGNW
jgi:hypothetical protein